MKNLKIAEIVPVSCLHLIENNQYHMCLAHLVGLDNDESRKYTEFYRRMSDEGKYVLMDNGAAENSQLSFEDLIKAYELINPTEIVLPDALCNSEETLRRTCRFYNLYKHRINKYNIMVVPQGNTYDEWRDCAEKLLEAIPVNTVGVSKFLEMETGEPNIRVRVSDFLRRKGVEVHLLGCSEGPNIVRNSHAVNSRVRGCDSAFAYIASKIEIDHIELNTVRAVGTIDFLYDLEYENTGRLLGEFETAAGIENNTVDGTWEV